MFGLSTRISDCSTSGQPLRRAVVDARTDSTAVKLWHWTFWINGVLHALFLVVALIAIFRS